MNTNKFFSFILLILFVISSGFIHLSDKNCRLNMDKDYIPEEQEYTAKFNEEGKAFFHSTFYQNTTYRIILCQRENEIVKFSIADHQNNLIFSNEDYNFPLYWDFHFENTVDCIITVESNDNNLLNNPDTATLLIGFKK